MEEVQELFATMQANWTAFETEHAAFSVKGNKAAGARARKAIQALKASVTKYKQASVASTKKPE